jgi:autoinducer 2-degrading protein
MFVQFVHIRIKPGRINDFLDVFRVNFEGTRAEPGNYRFDVLQDPEDDHHFVIYEAFESEAALDEHRKTAHYRETVAGLKDLMTTGTREKDYFRMVMPDHAAALAGA